jgi:hypothetical protein
MLVFSLNGLKHEEKDWHPSLFMLPKTTTTYEN